MTKYVPKPIPIQAVQSEVDGWIKLSEGKIAFKTGDWILTDAQGNKRVCENTIFEKNYTRVVELEEKIEGLTMDANEILSE
jgi:hypothetical protein